MKIAKHQRNLSEMRDKAKKLDKEKTERELARSGSDTVKSCSQLKADDPILTESQVAKLIGVSSRTLQHWRLNKTGPQFIKLGRLARYKKSQIEKFIQDNTISTRPLR